MRGHLSTDLPFDDGVFDVVWTDMSAMNIPDKIRLYEEMHRVLKPGGTLAISERFGRPYWLGPVSRPMGTHAGYKLPCSAEQVAKAS